MNKRAKGVCGLGLVVNDNGSAGMRTRKGWQAWGDKYAKQKQKQDRIPWTACVAYIEWRGMYRISLGYQQEEPLV